MGWISNHTWRNIHEEKIIIAVFNYLGAWSGDAYI